MPRYKKHLGTVTIERKGARKKQIGHVKIIDIDALRMDLNTIESKLSGAAPTTVAKELLNKKEQSLIQGTIGLPRGTRVAVLLPKIGKYKKTLE